jgi:N-acetylmuramoyl-L-alanine amidase
MIVHDPGHGFDGDNGCSENGINEAAVVLSIARDVVAGIAWAHHRMLREAAVGPGYTDRAQAALLLQPAIVLCHHINASTDPADRGTITFYDEGDEIGQSVAAAITRSVPGALLRTVNGIFPAKSTDWTNRAHWVIQHYRAVGLPVCLIEWGFATSVRDAAFLLNPLCRPGIVAAAAAGIARAMEITADPNLACAPKE